MFFNSILGNDILTKLFLSIVFLMSMVLTNIDAHITRLPCEYHGNFSVINIGKRYNGTVIKVLPDLNKVDCCISCVANNSCEFVNHKLDNSSCELMNNKSAEQTDEEWETLTTKHDSTNKGPLCRSTRPCPSGSLCHDSCEDPGYKCSASPWVLLSLNKPASQQTGDPKYPAALSVDGNTNQHFNGRSCNYARPPANNHWLQVDLEHMAFMKYVTIYNRMDVGFDQLKNVDIYTATSSDMNNDRALCVLFDSISDASGIESFDCVSDNIGRYIRLTVNAINKYFHVCEFQVYGFYI